ncbi:MAG: acetyl-CoA carboxylase biotin carboxyl carrier protein subunit [Acidobacteriota bacterium]
MDLVAQRDGGREAEVAVESLDDDRVRVRVGPNVYTVDRRVLHRAPGLQVVSLIDVESGDQHTIAVHNDSRGGAGAYRVHAADGSDARITLLDPLAHRAAQASGGAEGGGAQQVEAYMPGVVRVLVAEGDTVAVDQPVAVLVAMKMENEIVAETAGTVTRVFVEDGQAVEGGDPLVAIG